MPCHPTPKLQGFEERKTFPKCQVVPGKVDSEPAISCQFAKDQGHVFYMNYASSRPPFSFTLSPIALQTPIPRLFWSCSPHAESFQDGPVPNIRSSLLHIYFNIIMSRTNIMIKIKIIVICILSFAFLATVPKFFRALSNRL